MQRRSLYLVSLLVGLAIMAVIIADFKLFNLTGHNALLVKFCAYGLLLPVILYMLFKKPAGFARNAGIAFIIIAAIILFTLMVREWRMG